MNMLRRVPTAIFLLFAFLLVASACKKGTTTSQTGGGASPEVTGGAPEGLQKEGKPPDMCKIIAISELESAMGGKLSAEAAGEPTETKSSCSWDVSWADEESPSGKLELTLDKDQEFEENSLPQAERVDGLGKNAFWASSIYTLGINLGEGDSLQIYTVGMHGGADEAEGKKLAKDHAISVAKLVLQKL